MRYEVFAPLILILLVILFIIIRMAITRKK